MRKIKNLIPGERVTINQLETTFSHINCEGHPVFDVVTESGSHQYELSHLTGDHYLIEIN